MNRRLQWTAGLMLVALSATAFAQTQYDYLGWKMLNTHAYPFRYYIDGRASAPAGIALAEVEKATNAAFQLWENVSCAYPAFQYMGRSPTVPAINPNDVGNPYDTFNVSTVWVTSSSDKYYGSVLNSGQLASGSLSLNYAGYLYQCDIFLNAVSFKWTTLASTNPSQNLLDVQTAIEHEIGHCMGLADLSSPTNAVMNATFPVGGSRRSLTTEDTTLLCNYYPENLSGTATVGSPCDASNPCYNGLTCVPFKDATGGTLYQYCSQGCKGVTNGECPSPFLCRDSSLIKNFTKACLAVPGEFVTQIGKVCTNDDECGGPRSLCQLPVQLPSGNPAWVGGYCKEQCETTSTSNLCPQGSVCSETGAQDSCLKPCVPGGTDCRDGYACAPLKTGNVCIPNCYSDADCPSDGTTSFICRACDHLCIQNNPSTHAVGDPCTDSSQCGAGQSCLSINGNPQGICTQSCSTSQCGCPSGSACKNVGGDQLCMKACDQGTCASPLQCSPVGQSYSCLPPCRNAADCPTGYACNLGQCQDQSYTPDAGCTLCSSDGGPPPPPPTDGGTGGSTSPPSGCGCGEAPASAMVFLGVLALVLFSGRRRSWQRP